MIKLAAADEAEEERRVRREARNAELAQQEKDRPHSQRQAEAFAGQTLEYLQVGVK